MDTNGTGLAAQARELEHRWSNDPRFAGIKRSYTASDVVRLRGTLPIEHTLARAGATRLWSLLQTEEYIPTFGALTGAQAVQMVKAGLKAVYLSGWQVAADANSTGQTYPDMSLYSASSAPEMVKRINNALTRSDQISASEGSNGVHWYAPIVADCEAGFGGPPHAYELARAMIEAGAAGVHFEDQLAAAKKCGHMGGKVLIPTSQFIHTLNAARLAADIAGVPTVLMARTDSLNGKLLTSDIDPVDREFVTGERTPEGYYVVTAGIEAAIARGLSYAPYADLIWCETSTPDLKEAARFAEAIHESYPGKLLAYNCSPSFNWKQNLDDETIAGFQKELAAMGYKFQFITLAGWHSVNLNTFTLAREYGREGMPAYVRLQEEEFASEQDGYTAARHQREVGAGYFDQVLTAITAGEVSTAALVGSTEAAQFNE